MSAALYNLFIEQGATFQKTITWKDSSGTAINLTGYTARMQFRRVVTATDVLFSASSSYGITLGGTAGTIDIIIPATTTSGFTFTDAVYDLELQSSGGIVTRLMEGGVAVSKEVTR